MSALTDMLFPKSDTSKCLHLEINISKPVHSITTTRDCENSQIIVACSENCKNELLSMITFDVLTCTKCSNVIKPDDCYVIKYSNTNYNIYVCADCKESISTTMGEELRCEECGKVTKTKCVCLKVGYCSRECQIKKRPTHKLVCCKPV